MSVKPAENRSSAPSRSARKPEAPKPAKTESAKPKAESKPPADRATISAEARRSEPSGAKSKEHLASLTSNFGEPRTLRDNGSQDGSNCIDRASAAARPDDRALFLKDNRPDDANQAGHVVLERDGSIVDPTSGQSYANREDYLQANPQYGRAGEMSVQGQTSGENLQRITQAATPEEREAAIQAAGLEGIANERYADRPFRAGEKPGGEHEYDLHLGYDGNQRTWRTTIESGAYTTKDGEMVGAKVKKFAGNSLQVGADNGKYGASANVEGGQQSVYETTMTRDMWDRGQFPKPEDNPMHWQPGTSVTVRDENVSTLGLEASYNAFTAGSTTQLTEGAATAVQRVKDDDRNFDGYRRLRGTTEGVENVASGSVGVGAGGYGVNAGIDAKTSVDNQRVTFEEFNGDASLRNRGTIATYTSESKVNAFFGYESPVNSDKRSANINGSKNEVTETRYTEGTDAGRVESTLQSNLQQAGIDRTLEAKSVNGQIQDYSVTLAVGNPSPQTRPSDWEYQGAGDWLYRNGDRTTLTKEGIDGLHDRLGYLKSQGGDMLRGTMFEHFKDNELPSSPADLAMFVQNSFRGDTAVLENVYRVANDARMLGYTQGA